jgi:hypothetical protein
VLYERGHAETGLELRSEIAYGGAVGAHLDLAYLGGANRFRLEARHQPRELASIGVGRPRGSFADVAWDASVGRDLAVSVTGSLNRYDLPLFSQRNGAASLETRYRLFGRVFLRSGLSLGAFEPPAPAPRLRSLTVPVGVSYEGAHAGLTALYRYQESDATNSGGSGGRLSGRTSLGGFRLSVFVDRQDETPTLDLVFRQEPALARALAELGLDVRTPEDLVRVLRENPALVELGYFEGATLTLDASRVQAGGELGWRSSQGQHQLRASLLLDRARSVGGLRRTSVGSLQYTGRVSPSLELLTRYTRWSSDAAGRSGIGHSSYEAGLRLQIDDVPHLPSSLRRGRVSGFVFRDDDGTGRFTGQPLLPGTEVRLDGRVATTDAHGRFTFEGVEPGPHRLEAVLPSDAGAYFTTSSAVTLRNGEPASFGIAQAPARLDGTVRNDVGTGLAGVTALVSGMGRAIHVVTDSSGRLRFAGAAGEYEVRVQPDSLPAGYDTSRLAPQRIRLAAGAPARFDEVVRAQRSVCGRVSVTDTERVLVRLVELDRTTELAADGSYVFRNLAPGRYTVVAEIAGRTVSRQVDVPESPGVLRDVDLSF